MSIFKRITSFLLALVMVAGMLPLSHVHAEEMEASPVCLEEEIPVTSEVNETETRESQPEVTVAETLVNDAEAAAVSWELDGSGKLTISGTGEITASPWLDQADYIQHVVIGEGITGICAYAFEDCINLTTLELPSTLKNVSANAFFGTRNIQKVHIPDLKTWCAIPWHTSLYCNPLEGGAALYVGGELVTQLVIPEGTTAVSAYAFVGCTSITDVVIPEGVTSIGEGAFQNCRNLETAVLPTTLKTIGRSAFHTSGLKTVKLPQGLTAIGGYAFANTDLEEITFPGSVNLISAGAFENCTKLATIIFNHSAEDALQIGTDAFRVYEDTYTLLQVLGAGEPHPAIAGYDWAGSRRVFTNECEGEHTVAAEGDKAPTCTEPGYVGKTWCQVCGKILSQREELPALGHTEVIDEAKAPTCVETGLTEGKHCSVCKVVLVAQEEVPALGHTEVIDAAIAPTCTETGLTEGKHCDLCNEVLTAQEEIPALGHDYEAGICQICGADMKADHEIFSGKSLTLKPINPNTGKAYTAKQLNWSMEEKYDAFATLKNGTITTKKVFEKTRIEVAATVLETGKKLTYTVDIYPAVTQIEAMVDGELVANNATILMDFTDESKTIKINAYPEDTLANVQWTISDKKGQYAEYAIEGDTLTITNPKQKAGTVTIKATVDAGVKKTVTVKVSFGSYADTVAIEAPEKTTLRGGNSMTLKAAITKPESVTQPGLVWTTSDKAAATVSNGKVTAKNVAHPTTVTITATSKDGQAKASIDLTIIPKNEGQLVLMENGKFVTNGTKSLNKGDSCTVTAAVITKGEPVPVEATWSTSKTEVAKVKKGLITATGPGSAKITVAAKGMKVTLNVMVTTLVNDMTITTKDGKNIIEENSEKLVLLSSGKNVTLATTVNPAAASNAVTWDIVEGGTYAKISNGKVTANKDLTSVQYITVKATAKDGSGASATIRVKIVPLATGVQIFQNGTRVRSNTTYVHDMMVSDTIKLSAKVYPAKANQSVTLISSNKKIADFVNGELVCYKTGSVTVTATAQDGSNMKATFKLTIVKKVQSLTLKDGANLTVVGGKTLKLAPMVQINPADATNKKLTWSVAPNELGIKISTSGVLSTKKVTEPVTINVMVTTQDGSGKMLSINVTVNPG